MWNPSISPFERAVAEGGAPCPADEARRWTAAEVAERVDATAARLQALGVGPGEVVALMMTNRLELIISLFAAWRLGAVAPPINPTFTAAEAAFQLTDSGARVVVVDAALRAKLDSPAAAALRNGVLHTGDVGYLDEGGYLVLVDRSKDMIIRGGENIYPKEIETVLHGHPGVLESAVVGASDPRLGEVPVAFVQLRPGATTTAEDLRAHCRAFLARDKLPTEIRLVESLPRNAVGKVSKPALRERIAPRSG